MVHDLGQYPCRKINQFLLLNHTKKPWKVNQQIKYGKFLPHSKQYVRNWSSDNIYGPAKDMMDVAIDKASAPEIIYIKYSKINDSLWTILNDPLIFEILTISLTIFNDLEEVHKLLNGKIKPTIIGKKAIEQFSYFFWNVSDKNRMIDKYKLINLLKSEERLSKSFNYLVKYIRDPYGKDKFLIHYDLVNTDEPNISVLLKGANLNSIELVQAYKNNNLERAESLSKVLLNTSKSIKNLNDIKKHSNIKGFFDEISLIGE